MLLLRRFTAAALPKRSFSTSSGDNGEMWKNFSESPKYFDKQERFTEAPELEPNVNAAKIAENASRLRQRFAEYQNLLYEKQYRKRFHTLFISAARMQQYHEIQLKVKQQVREAHPSLEQNDELKFLSLVKFRILDEYGDVYQQIRTKIVQNELDPRRKPKYEDEVNAYLNRMRRLE